MPKTGSILDVFSLMAILLPLFPICIIVIRKVELQQGLNLLITVCLLSFLQHLILLISNLQPLNAIFINAIFNLAEMVILFSLFKTVLPKNRIREFLNLVIISFISIVLTIYSLKGVAAYEDVILVAEALFLIIISLFALYQIISSVQLYIFNVPMFWIAGGTLCYFSIFLLAEGLKKYEVQFIKDVVSERQILLSAISMVRFIFYIVATLHAPVQKGNHSENS